MTMMVTITAAVTTQALRKTAFNIAKTLLLVDEGDVEEKVSESNMPRVIGDSVMETIKCMFLFFFSVFFFH
jgi:hypothetical protein